MYRGISALTIPAALHRLSESAVFRASTPLGADTENIKYSHTFALMIHISLTYDIMLTVK
jgi:hypothetical protein